MFRRRLREAMTPEELAKVYAVPHDARRYGYGHYLRVEATIVLARWMAIDFRASSVADLSTGNAAIVDALPSSVKEVYLGDFAPGYEFHGPIEETVFRIPSVDLFICSETIEHLDDPEGVLEAIRQRARTLILSTPIGEDDLGNPEHYWGWDQEAVEKMVRQVGWTPRARTDLVLPDTYSYQLWALEAAS